MLSNRSEVSRSALTVDGELVDEGCRVIEELHGGMVEVLGGVLVFLAKLYQWTLEELRKLFLAVQNTM